MLLCATDKGPGPGSSENDVEGAVNFFYQLLTEACAVVFVPSCSRVQLDACITMELQPHGRAARIR